MDFLKKFTSAFKTAGGAVQNAVEVVAEKNRKTALQNRLRTVIRCEEKAAERAYLALGRYYYNNMRDASNAVTEPYCVDIEAAEQRIDAAVQKLEALCREEEQEEIEEITLEDVQEIAPPEAEETVPEGIVDEAVEAAEPAAELPTEEPAAEPAAAEEPAAESAVEQDESETLPYA